MTCPSGLADLNETINTIANLGGVFFEEITDVGLIGSIKTWILTKGLNDADWLITNDISSYVIFQAGQNSFLVPFIKGCASNFVGIDAGGSVELFKLLLGI